MDVPDFRTVTVEALAALVREGALTAAAVTEHALERIETLNPRLNAFVAVDADAARAQAARVDERVVAGHDPGPLAGIPIGVKDLEDAAGFATVMGAPHRRDAAAVSHDSTEVARLRAAGCVVIGKTNTPEYGCVGDTFNPVFGATLNPWNTARSPGGSSGGTSAAVASGMVPVGTGSDGGGSIRIPSAVCGLSGIKTSAGRVPSGPPAPGALDLSSVGPMARRIRDVALCLDAVVGPHPADLRSLPAPQGSWRAALDSPRAPARVLWAPQLDGEETDSEILAACTAAVERLADAGVEVEESTAVLDLELSAFLLLFYGGTIAPAYEALRGGDEWDRVTPLLRMLLDHVSERLSVAELADARRRAGGLSLHLDALMNGFDVLVLPTVAGQTPLSEGPGTVNGEETPNWMRFTPLANLTRRPAGSVCCGFTADAMPVGLQVIGHQHDDLAVLETLTVLEDMYPSPVAPL